MTTVAISGAGKICALQANGNYRIPNTCVAVPKQVIAARVLLSPNFRNQVLGNNVAPFHAVGRIAMQPNPSAGCIKARPAWGQQARDHASEHIARTSRGQFGWRVAIDLGSTIGRSNDRVRPLKYDNSS